MPAIRSIGVKSMTFSSKTVLSVRTLQPSHDLSGMLGCIPMLRRSSALLLGLAPLVLAQHKNTSMTYHAMGTFTVDVHPLTPAPAEGLSRLSMDKQIQGDLEATSKGEMFSGGDPKQGVAGYVAMEVVTGTLKGKKG